MARLTAEEWTTCILMDQLGYTEKVIADRIGRSQNAVSLAIKRHQDTGSREDRPIFDRPNDQHWRRQSAPGATVTSQQEGYGS